MRIVLESMLERVSSFYGGTVLTVGKSSDGTILSAPGMEIMVSHAHDIRTSFIGKPCRIVVEFDEPDAPTAVIPSDATSPLDEGWRVLAAALEARGFVRAPFDGTRVVRFVERNASNATSMPRWVTVSDEYATRFSGASESAIELLLSAMGIQ